MDGGSAPGEFVGKLLFKDVLSGKQFAIQYFFFQVSISLFGLGCVWQSVCSVHGDSFLFLIKFVFILPYVRIDYKNF